MREFLFRGKRINGDGWAYGDLSLHVQDGAPHIFPSDGYDSPECYEVDPESLGQSTGLPDKNGKTIFEGDICKVDGEDVLASVEWSEDEAMFRIEGDGLSMGLDKLRTFKELEVVGNTYDDHKLLEG